MQNQSKKVNSTPEGHKMQEQNKEGVRGQLVEGSHNLRADTRMAAQMISLGVIHTEQAASLLRDGFALASECARNKNSRGYKACMGIAVQLARLEQVERLHQDGDGDTNVNVSIGFDWDEFYRRSESKQPDPIEAKLREAEQQACISQLNGKNGKHE